MSSSVLSCKLAIVPQQRELLDRTLHAFAAACNAVWTYGRQNGIAQQRLLHRAYYTHIRKVYGLPANLAIRVIARVAHQLRKSATQPVPFSPDCAMFDSRTFLFQPLEWAVRLTLLHGREKFHLDVSKHHQERLYALTPTAITLFKKYNSYYVDFYTKPEAVSQ